MNNLQKELEAHIHVLGCQAITEARNLGYAEAQGKKVDDGALLDMIEEHEKALTTLIQKRETEAYDNGYNDAWNNIHTKYEVGAIAGNYKITERFKRVGKNTKYKVVCNLCGAPMFRYSNKFKLPHKDCPAIAKSAQTLAQLSKEIKNE